MTGQLKKSQEKDIKNCSWFSFWFIHCTTNGRSNWVQWIVGQSILAHKLKFAKNVIQDVD